jgi:tetratricopeptide (TPR) repeat protein
MNQQALLSQKLSMASRYLADSNYREAARLYQQVLSIEPDNIAANYAVAGRLLTVKRDGLAREYLERVIAREPTHFQARLRLLEIAYDHGERKKQSALLQELIATTSENYQLLQLAQTMRYMTMPRPAIDILTKCLEVEPGQYDVHCTMAVSYRELGEFELTERHVREAIRIDPGRVEAYALLAQLDKVDDGATEATAMNELHRCQDTLDDKSRILLNYSLGKIIDKRGETEPAFQHYLAANKIQSSMLPYLAEDNRERFSAIQSAFSKEFFLENPRVGSDSTCPIFIVGMPRSGTSLVEQILSSHPQVFGAGELDDFDAFAHRLEVIRSKPFFEEIADFKASSFERFAGRYLSKIQALSHGADRVTDKMPQNFRYIGLIKLAFPSAKIIHCRRNPVDTCLSLFTNIFGGTHQYSHDLSNLGYYYRDYAKLMQHWHAVLPFRIYDVQYEDIVADSENEIRALLNFCELPFDQGCLEFHKNKRVVATASATQVRRPMYQDSIQRWTRYGKQLAPLVEILREEGLVDISGPELIAVD